MFSTMRSDYENLANSPEMKEFTTILGRLAGIAMALNPPDTSTVHDFTPAGVGNGICRLIRSTLEGKQRCQNCDRENQQRAAKSGRPLRYRCHAGFVELVVPLFVQDKHVATISCGQLLPEAPSEEGFLRCLKRLKWLQAPQEKLRNAYFAAPYLPSRTIDSLLRLQLLFAQQLCESARHMREIDSMKERSEIRRAREYINENFRKNPLLLSEVAAHAALSPAHFSHIFHMVVGEPFAQYVQMQRIAEAKRLLQTTEQTVLSIAEESGFSCLCHFNRVFKRFEKCSPTQFRTKYQNCNR